MEHGRSQPQGMGQWRLPLLLHAEIISGECPKTRNKPMTIRMTTCRGCLKGFLAFAETQNRCAVCGAKMVTCVKVTEQLPDGPSSSFLTMEASTFCMDALNKTFEPGQKFLLEIVECTQAELDALPEFECFE